MSVPISLWALPLLIIYWIYKLSTDESKVEATEEHEPPVPEGGAMGPLRINISGCRVRQL